MASPALLHSDREILVKLDKSTAIASSIFLVLSLCIIIVTPSASGYEISIYSAYPWYFWFFICSSISLGVISLIHRSFWPKDQSNWWKISVYTVVFANLIIILLPVFRGYYLPNGGDLIIHLGYVKDITLNGNFGNENFYPLSHILAAILNFITGLDLVSIIKFLPPVFYILYMVSLYLLAKVLGGKTEHGILIMAFGSVPLFLSYNTSFLPMHFFVLLLPLIVMLLQKTAASSNKAEYIAILVLILIAMPFLHPYESIFLVAIFLIYAASILIYRSLTKRMHHDDRLDKHPLAMSLISALLVSVVFVLWFYQFDLFMRIPRFFHDLATYGFQGQSILGDISSQVQVADVTGLDLVGLMIRRHGPQLIFCLLSLLAILIIVRRVFRERASVNEKDIFFALTFSFFLLIFAVTIVGLNFGIGDSPRILNHAFFAAPILIGLVFYSAYGEHLGSKFWRLKIWLSLTAATIIVCVVLGIFTVYSSPYTMSASTQVTRMQWNGLEWFFHNKTDSPTIYLEEITRRAPVAIFGTELLSKQSVGSFFIGEEHFGYDVSDTLGHLYSSPDIYIVISERNRAIYTVLWPDTGHYSLNDFERLKSDPTLSLVYYNGDLEIWVIHRSV